jgi:hypothetical protein
MMVSGGRRPIAPATSLGRQLDKLMAARWLPEAWVKRLWNPADLPVRLELRIRALSDECVWRAYTDGARLWCAIACPADPPCRQQYETALKVVFFGDDAELSCGGVWSCDRGGEWHFERPMDTSADSDVAGNGPRAHVVSLLSFQKDRSSS